METHYGNSAVDEEYRAKRRASSDEWTANKKRALSSTSGSPIAANGAAGDAQRAASRSDTVVDEPEKEDDLERFRKGAIFRRMRHYQREYSRAHERIQHLESSLRLANLERIEAESCWSNTMETIRRLTQLETIMMEAGQSLKTIFPSRMFSPEDFKKTRKSSEAKAQAAETVINAFVKFAGKVDRPKYEELFSECQDLQQSNTFLTAEAEQTYALLEDAQRDRDRYLGELRVVQAKLDRLQSRILNPELEREPEPDLTVKVNGEVKMEVEPDGGGLKKEDTPLAALPPVNAINEPRYDEQEWEARLQIRDDRLTELEKENATLRDKLVMANSEVNLLAESTIAKTPAYRVLLDHASKTEALLSEERQQLSNAREEIAALRQIQTSWQEDLQSNDAKEISELKFLLKKRDDDLNRIRQHREQLETQHKEMKATYDSKRSSLAKYKELADSRGERIELLSSEIRRLKARLAAAAGDEDLLNFLQNDANIDVNYVEDVKKRLNVSEKELKGLRATLQDTDRGLIDVASLRMKLESAAQQLETYKSTAGSDLAERLEAKDNELRAMKLKETQSAQEMTELFSEMDRLSKAWESADKQSQTQALSLEKWEEEKEKLMLAKQKSDNKYYKAMSESEAREGERKQALRNSEKLAKRIEAMEKNEKDLQTINDSLSREVAAVKQAMIALRCHLERAERDYTSAKLRYEEESQRTVQLRDHMKKREKDVSELNMVTVKLKDELHKTTKEAEKATQKAKTLSMPIAPASERESVLQKEVEKCMRLLKCSTCQNAFRNTIITKCLHTFCKACVDARISHRQRKCPACNLAFAQSDVQTFYLQ